MVQSQKNHVLLTGVTGFVGKVVLEELLRRREELGIDCVSVLIRQNNKKGGAPKDRFDNELAKSPCFSKLPANWKESVRVVAGDLTLPMLGIRDQDRIVLQSQVTHFINCAASVEFTLPVAEAALSNITTSLHALEFARSILNLRKMVHVSTAYVAPHSAEPKLEQIVPMPRPAEEIYQDIVSGLVTGEELLAETGHPNTYTLTKCIAEHLLTQRKGNVPLIFLRPSIVSACWSYPFKGWIDSLAAFAGFVSLIGSGQLRTLVARRDNLLDMVPCDIVADRIIYCAFKTEISDMTKPEFRHAVAGIENNCSVLQCIDGITGFFAEHQVYRHPELYYIGPRNRRFRFLEWYYQRRPLALMRAGLALTGQVKKSKFIKRLAYQLKYLNSSFPYFTHNTFDFRSSLPFQDETFHPLDYVRAVSEGVYKNIMKMNPRQVALGGKKQKSFGSDLMWAMRKPNGNWAIRLTSTVVRKAMRRCVELVTFDQDSFVKAMKLSDPHSLTIVVPTHRSYGDFILCSYLFFSHPELGISIPHIAAAHEFSKIPVLGWLFRKMKAFYIKRGVGKESQELTEQVHHLVHQRQTLEFFVEGTRSRSRQMLQPRRGMLKCIQSTRQRCTILPVSISYDRVPEEMAFVKELQGMPRPKMTLRSVIKWFAKIVFGQVKLGRIHISCGEPKVLDTTTDISKLGLEICSELQRGLVVTTHHLQSFLNIQNNSRLTLSWLIAAIQRRGGIVIESSLFDDANIPEIIEKTTRYQWTYLFIQDVLHRFPDHPALTKHAAKNLFFRRTFLEFTDERRDGHLDELLFKVFAPICDEYSQIASRLMTTKDIPSPEKLVSQNPSYFLPYVLEVYEDLVARNIISISESDDGYKWSANSGQLESLINQYQWPIVRMDTLAAAS